MPIPAFDLGLVLPPFVGPEPGNPATQSPYPADTLELTYRFGTSPHRGMLLRGLLNYREALRGVGISVGFQWIDGSFVEDKERRLGLSPGDIDVVTVFERPNGMEQNSLWFAAMAPHADLFNPAACKARFGCEAFSIDLGISRPNIARQSAFWFNLFSHQRDTFRWKGVVICPLGPTNIDGPADAELRRRGY